MAGFTTSNQKPLFWRLLPGERRVILLLGDGIATIVALMAALYFWAQRDWLAFSWEFLKTRPPFWFYLLPVFWMILLIELYDVRRAAHIKGTLTGLGIAAGLSLAAYLLVYFTSAPNSLPRRGVAAFIIVCFILTLIWRLFYIRIFTAPLFMRRVIIVGAGRAGSTMAQIVKSIWPLPFYVVGYIDDDPQKIGTEIEDHPVLGGAGQLMEMIKRESVTDLVFAISGEMNIEMLEALLQATEMGVEISTMPSIYEELQGRVPILLLQSDWVLRSFADQSHSSGTYEVAKRVLDFLIGLIGTLILMVVFPFVALATLLETGRPILYPQARLGKNGHPFNMLKFRTMRQDAEKDGVARPASLNDGRVTKVGNFLRKSHLDELPQFINILLGVMSMVGPRAERSELVDMLQTKVPFYRTRLMVKPGLTGWAQVNFGYASTVEDMRIKLEYDLYYIKHRNLLLDLVIIFRTVGAVIGFKGR